MSQDILREAEAVKALKAALEAYDDEVLVNDMIEGGTSFREACEQIVKGLDEDDILIAGLKQRLNAMSVRLDRIKKRREQRRAVLEHGLTIASERRLELPTCTLVLAKRADRLLITDESVIPAEFWKTGRPLLQRDLLKARLKEGPVDGAELAEMPASLTIKRS